MNSLKFERLLEERDELQAEHQEWCNDVNGALGTGEVSHESRQRDRVYRRLCVVEEQIESELAAERARGEA